jgi:hypothetical protein
MDTKQPPLPLSIKINPLRFRFFILLVAFFTTCNSQINAQGSESILKKIELGFNTGPLFFLGDLGGNIGAGTQF